MSSESTQSNSHQSKPNNKEIWSNFKRLNLVQVAKDLYGYVIDPKGSYNRNDGNLETIHKNFTHLKLYQPVLIGGEKKQANVILVRKNKRGEYFYTNVTSPSDQGSIIDFIGNRAFLDPKEKSDLSKIAKIISEYDGTAVAQAVLPTYIPEPEIKKDRIAILGHFHKLLASFNNPEYLLARGLTRETLETPELKKRIFNSRFYDTQKNQHINIAFPIVDKDDKLCGIEHKNIGFSGYEKESERQIWRSNIVDLSRPVEAFLIGEAVIDVISYAQINNLFGKNILMIAHGGNLTNDQIHTIQFLINQHKPHKVITLEDRDAPGYRYDINLVGGLTKPATPSKVIAENDLTAEISIKDRVVAVLQVKFAFKELEGGKKIVQGVMDDFNKLNQVNEIPVFKITGEDIKFGNNSATLRVEFHVSELNMKRALNVIVEHRGLQEFIKVEKPQGVRKTGEKIVDWNELLMKEKNISKDDIKKLVAEFKENSVNDSAIIYKNGIKPEELLKVFLKEWDKDILIAQERAVEAGVDINVISQLIAKNQLLTFNNFVLTVQRVYDLDIANFSEFEKFKGFLLENENRYKQVIQNRKMELNTFDHQLTLVKAKLQFDGDKLNLDEFNTLMMEKDRLEEVVKTAKRSLGMYNEYLDGKYFSELETIAISKSTKIWDKIISETVTNNKNDTEVIKNNGDKKTSLKQ